MLWKRYMIGILFFLFQDFLKERWKKMRMQNTMSHSQKLCLCTLPAGITEGYNHLSWLNNFEEKSLNLFSYTLKKWRFLFVMVKAKTDFLSKNPFSVFWKLSGTTHIKWLVYFQWFFNSSLVTAPQVQYLLGTGSTMKITKWGGRGRIASPLLSAVVFLVQMQTLKKLWTGMSQGHIANSYCNTNRETSELSFVLHPFWVSV